MEKASWEIRYLRAAENDISKLSRAERERILKTIKSKLGVSPELFGLPLKGALKHFWRLRAGDYRVIYELVKTTVLVIAVLHRKDIYREIQKRLG